MANFVALNNNVAVLCFVSNSLVEAEEFAGMKCVEHAAVDIGAIFHEELGEFRPAKIFDSWEFNSETGKWEAPVPVPEEGDFIWDEDALAWVERVIEIPEPAARPIEEETNATDA